jgi:hypothetical protein
MSCYNNKCYLPDPPRAWSRVQNNCSLVTDIIDTSVVPYTFVVPYTNEIVPAYVFQQKMAMLEKGNILQYKANSSNLTKAQRYAKIAKGQWVNRNTTWATQSTRGYTNPNSTSLKRTGNFVNIAIDPITGAVIGPTTAPVTCPKTDIPINYGLPMNNGVTDGQVIPPPPPPNPNPNNDTYIPLVEIADTNPIVIQDGGSLICSIQENVCTGEIKINVSQQVCSLTTASDVPGPIGVLCWNDGTPTWYPRQRYVMTNSANKWPLNAKLVSAINCKPQIETIENIYTGDNTDTDNNTGNGDGNDGNDGTGNILDYKIVKTIIGFYNTLIQGNIEELIPSLSLDKMGVYFEQLKNITTAYNSTTVGFYTKILNSIYISSGTKKNEIQATSLANQYKNDSDTLRDPDKLKKYLDSLQNNFDNLFDTIDIKPALLTIKKEYLEYHKKYGIPPDFIYDFDKLNEIRKRL